MADQGGAADVIFSLKVRKDQGGPMDQGLYFSELMCGMVTSDEGGEDSEDPCCSGAIEC